MLTLFLCTVGHAADWKTTLEAVKPAVVSIRVSATRSFDTSSARFSYATGFIVDAQRGIILTNRHVVQSGPVVAEAILENNEEITLTPIYRDPVHDFGFFQFDPEDVRFLEPVSLPLRPDAVDVGDEVRVIGNDAGEKGSVLSGTIARLDRSAPAYGRDNYNDFNTFYIQSSSGTSGGSSGSPVIDIDGNVLALNAGSRRSAATSYFLPLDRVVRALSLLQSGDDISRGTLQATFEYLAYDEVRRRGLQAETEVEMRAAFPEATGMLVVDKLLPKGPADGVLRTGDILVRLDGTPLTSFVALESALDAAVGQPLTVDIERNGQPLSLTLTVGDLHAITPDAFLEWGGSIFSPVSYQRARSRGVPVEGVILTSRGYAMTAAGVLEDSIITHIDGTPVPDLRALEAVLAAHPDGEEILVRSFHISNPRRENIDVVRSERRWFPMQYCTEGATVWDCVASPEAPPPAPATVAETTWPEVPDRIARKVARSMVVVDFDIPYRTDGVSGGQFKGAGLVVDAERGIVAVDRDTVPVMMGDITVTFAGSVSIPGQAVWLHPEHNLALIRYDPALIGATPVVSATLNDTPLSAGDRVWQVGLSSAYQVVSRKTTVDTIRPLWLGLPSTPAFRDTNLDTIRLQGSASSIGGVIIDRSGTVRATWASFVDNSGDREAYLRGMASEHLIESLESYTSGAAWHGLGAELGQLSLVDARNRGLPAEEVARLEAHDEKRRVLEVHRLMAGSPSAEHLKAGDLILRAGGQTVTVFREVERAVRGETVSLDVLRDGAVVSVEMPTTALPTTSAMRLVGFAGAMLQTTPIWLAHQRGHVAEGVYVCWYWYGSPAAQYGLKATRRIVAVNGEPIADLDALLEVVDAMANRDTMELTTERLDGHIEVSTLRLDLHYWPTFEVRQTESGWQRIVR